MCHGRGCGVPRIQTIVPEDALYFAALMLKALEKVADLDGKTGGMFCLMDGTTGKLVIEPTEIGDINNGKKDKYAELCLEKATRLLSHIASNSHCLSWQSRDPENGLWGGALSDDGYIWSFSGLSEAQDEALMIMSAHYIGRINNGSPEIFAGFSDNKYILNNDHLFWIRQS